MILNCLLDIQGIGLLDIFEKMCNYGFKTGVKSTAI